MNTPKNNGYIKHQVIGRKTLTLIIFGGSLTILAVVTLITPPFIKARVQYCPASVAFGGTASYTYVSRASWISLALLWIIIVFGCYLTISLLSKRSLKYKYWSALALSSMLILLTGLKLAYLHIC